MALFLINGKDILTNRSISSQKRGEERHNTVTSIARWKDNQFKIDIVLRNNRTSDTYPDGIFRPHKNVQHIKKENIGLIEVMGLAILPGRLKDELEEVKRYLLGEAQAIDAQHQEWADALKMQFEINTEVDAQAAI